MTKITIYNIQRPLTPKEGKPSLWFLCFAHHLIVVNISGSFEKISQMVFKLWVDTILGQTDGKASMVKTICLWPRRGENKIIIKTLRICCDCEWLSTLDKIFSRQHTEIFFLFFPRKQDLTYHANCLQWRQLHEMSNPKFVIG